MPARKPTTISAGEFSIWLENPGADVPCGECRGCCRSSMFIHVGPEEKETIRRIPRKLLFPAPGLPKGHFVLGYNERGECPMLAGGECSIYEHRPQTCREYDCRVFAATGIAVDRARQPEIAARVKAWRFRYAGKASRERRRGLEATGRLASHLPPERRAAVAMQLYAAAPEAKRLLLSTIVDMLRAVPHVAAIALGGSHASGLARPDSDLDIGIYYRTASPFSIDAIRRVAEALATPGSVPVVTDPYGWGPWVNGGAWIRTPVCKVDFLYRSLDQLETVIAEGSKGVWRHDYDQQPPFGFRSVIYFGEAASAIPLHDPDGELVRLKQSVAVYPEPLRERIVAESLWNAEFTLHQSRGFAASADVVHTAACFARVAHFLIQALFAMNRRYFVNDKHALRLIDSFPLSPREFAARLSAVLAHPGAAPESLHASIDGLHALWSETTALSDHSYTPRFSL